jgi:hypothetical protein
MTATAHTLVAGAIATRIGNPYLAGFLALGSHFVLDAIPHWDFGTNWKIRPKWVTGLISISENLIGITVTYFLYRQKVAPLPLFGCIFLSLLPDWLEAPWYIFFAAKDKLKPSKQAGFWEKFTFKIYRIENSFHHKTKSMWFGIGIQIVVVGLIIFLLNPFAVVSP